MADRPARPEPPREPAKDVMQALGALLATGFLAVLAHKGYSDISTLAWSHPDGEFWSRLMRYFIANLAGG